MGITFKKLDSRSGLYHFRYFVSPYMGTGWNATTLQRYVLGVMNREGQIRSVKVSQQNPGVGGTSWKVDLYKELKNDGKAAPRFGGSSATASQAKVTFAGVVATDVVTVNGTAFTAVASNPTSVQFAVGATDAESITNFCAAINASTNANILNKVTAVQAALTDDHCQLVATTSTVGGYGGNALTLTKTDGH